MKANADTDRRLVLVADDDPVFCMIAAETIQSMDHKVETVDNGLLAVEFFKDHQPDIILLDVDMPNIDGFTACAEIRKLPQGDLIPILMLTGLRDMESISRAYNQGATDFQVKPVNWVILKQRIRYLLRAQDTMEAKLKSEAKNRALLTAIPDLMFNMNKQGEFLDYKPASNIELIAPSREFLGKTLHEILPDSLANQSLYHIHKALETGNTQQYEYSVANNGKVYEYEARTAVSGKDEVISIIRDITEQKNSARTLQKERDFISAVLDTASAMVLVRDIHGRIIRLNRACEELTGYSSDELHKKCAWNVLVLPADIPREKALYEGILSRRDMNEYTSTWIAKDGNQHLISWSNSILLDQSGDLEFVISTGIDITERKRAEARVQYLAYYDELTSLPNRTLFQEHLKQALAYSQRHSHLMALMFLDLDRFKRINDSFGHGLGDLLLRSVGDRLSSQLRTGDFIARLRTNDLEASIGRFGGDEFTLLFKSIPSIEAAAKIAARIQEIISEPFIFDNREIYISASIGISIYPNDGNDGETLLKNADAAMYEAKENGQMEYRFYTSSMNKKILNKLSIENDLRRAVGKQEFVIHYQPKIDIKSGQFVGLEALLRWNHPSKGLLLPADFISIAEETAIIIPIGEWVLRSVCQQSIQWQNEGSQPIPIAVNLSCIQFPQRDLFDTIAHILEETGLEARYLECELTESTIMQNEEEAAKTLKKLKRLGIKLSIDDFGVGYSSLSYLRQLALDTLKIDKSFIRDVPNEPDGMALSIAIIAMAHSLGLNVVAEGVETQQQLDFLRENGCDQAQGFLFSPARPSDEIPTLLAKGLPQYQPGYGKSF